MLIKQALKVFPTGLIRLRKVTRVYGGHRVGITCLVAMLLWPGSTFSATSVDQSTTRIVSLVPNLTELAFAVGAGSQIVGVSDYCLYPPEARTRPAVGGLVNPSLEGVLKLRPDVVLLYRSQTDFARRLKSLGIATELFQVDRLSDLYTAMDRVGKLTGHTTQTGQLRSDIQQDLGQIKTASAGAKPVKGIIVVSRDPASLRAIFQAPVDGFLGELFQIAGGRVAVSGGAALDRESIIRANPTVIIDMSGASSGAAEAGINNMSKRENGKWAELSTVSAVKNNNVFSWSNAHSTLLGPSVVDTAWAMRQVVEGISKPE